MSDVRLTTRYDEADLDSLYCSLHEFGHGLYEHQIDPALERTPLGRRRLERVARVAEPAVGEHGRRARRLLALVPAARAGGAPRALRRA